MPINDLCRLPADGEFTADVIIIGGGAAGITLAREFAGTPVRVLMLESGGMRESEETSVLSAVESVAEPSGAAQIAKRNFFHKANAALWSHEVQPYGVRCRGLGGSTQAWAGKSAPFDAIDFMPRDWIAPGGWPIPLSDIAPYIDRAARHLNLGPTVNDARLWDILGTAKHGPLDESKLRSYFWQFARSRNDPLDIMRFGPDFLREAPPNIEIFLNASVTQIFTEAGRFASVEIAAPGGPRHRARAPVAVLAASAIENARLLLASNSQAPQGLGNHAGLVGRYLMDHPGCRIARFDDPKAVALVHRHFGFYALRHDRRTHMYMHGLAPTPQLQQREKLSNSSVYMMEMRAPDDPWDALKALLRGQGGTWRHIGAVARSPRLIISGLGRKLLQHPRMPEFARKAIVDLVIGINPQFAASEFQFGGLPHKLVGLAVDAITEQKPDADNRVTLSNRTDAFGHPLARVEWRVGDDAKRSLARLGHLLRDEFRRAGLPAPVLEDWVERERLDEAVIIDMAHTSGTTRMSGDPSCGVVDVNSRLHHVDGLYVAGASVFPTSGHANPTLMICAMAIRLADHLKGKTAEDGENPAMDSRVFEKVNAGGPLVLVTGATGRIGRILTGALIDAGYRVRGQYARAPGRDSRIQWRHVDFAAAPDMDGLVEGCDAVIHLAAELHDVRRMECINVEASGALAAAAQKHGVRYFGDASSMVVYGSPVGRKVTESTPVLDPEKPVVAQYYADPDMREYARTKLLGERAIGAAAPLLNIDIYRIAVVAGLDDIWQALRWSRKRKLFSLYRRTQYIHDRDLAAAIIHLLGKGLARPAPSREVYNIVDPKAGTFADALVIARRKRPDGPFETPFHIPVVMDLLKAAVKYKAVRLRYPIGMIDYRADKLAASGFAPGIGFEKAVESAVDAFAKPG